MKVNFVETFEKWVRTAGLLCLLTLFALPAHAWWMCRYIVTSENAALFGYSSEEHDYVPVQFAKQGDTLYLLNEKGRLAVQKVNWDWVAYKWGKSYDPLFVNADDVQFAGFANPGNSPYLDDVALVEIPRQFVDVKSREHKEWLIFFAFALSIVFWGFIFFAKNEKVKIWGAYAVQVLILLSLFLNYMLGAVWGDHWFIDNAGGFVRSKLGELLLTAVAVTAVAGPYCVIFKITEQYDLRMMFVIGYGSVVLFFPVYFVLDFFATFPCRYSTYFIFYSLAVQMFVLLVQIVRKPESIGYYLSCLGMYLLAIVPVVYMVLDIFMVWLKGLGWVGNIQQIMEEGFW